MVMVKNESSDKALNQIYREVVSTIESSKSQIFDIYEKACREIELTKQDLSVLTYRVESIIERVDQLKIEAQQKKQELARVSKNFSSYSEADIRRCYGEAETAQVELAIAIEQETQLRQQRDRTQIRLHAVTETVNNAKNLAIQIGVVIGYLGSQLGDVVNQLELANKGKLLGIQIITAQENERLRLSREIHDGPAQSMANLIYQATICERMIDVDPGASKIGLREFREQTRDCLSEIRQVIFDLRPMSLDDLGLQAALQQYLVKFKERSNIDVRFETEGTVVPINKFVEVSFFRIVQEALNNIYQHANTKTAAVFLRYNKDNISAVIEDHGVGFDTEQQPPPIKPGEVPEHFGITGMRERASIIKAQLIFASNPGHGTKVRLLLPLEDVI